MPKSRNRRRSQPPRRPTRTQGARSRAARPPLVAQPAPGLRGKVERATAPVLVWLSSLPTFVLPIASVALLFTGLAAPAPVGIPAMVLVIVLIGWLTYVSWPAVRGVQRLLRVTVVLLLVAALLGRLVG